MFVVCCAQVLLLSWNDRLKVADQAAYQFTEVFSGQGAVSKYMPGPAYHRFL